MLYLFWIILGFFGGVIVSKNTAQMTSPQITTVFLVLIVACGIMWWAGYRGKSTAVATAVATAISVAKAEANANAKAVANSAINFYLGQQAGITPEIIGQIVDHSTQEIRNSEKIENLHSTMTVEKETV